MWHLVTFTEPGICVLHVSKHKPLLKRIIYNAWSGSATFSSTFHQGKLSTTHMLLLLLLCTNRKTYNFRYYKMRKLCAKHATGAACLPVHVHCAGSQHSRNYQTQRGKHKFTDQQGHHAMPMRLHTPSCPPKDHVTKNATPHGTRVF